MRLWVLDEMRHGLHGFTRRVWGLPGHRPVAATQHVYQWGYVYGAVGLGLARSEFPLAETVDQTHLGHFYRQIVTVRQAFQLPTSFNRQKSRKFEKINIQSIRFVMNLESAS